MKKKQLALPKHATIKLSVTVKSHLEHKYDDVALKKINAAVQRWKEADAKRDIQTVHVAVDDPSKMHEVWRNYFPKAPRVRSISGKPTPVKIKRAIDDLWERLRPKYLVLFGGDDVVPMFKVPNPTLYWRTDVSDWDRMLRTDNPYASSQAFDPQDIDSYLVPDRVIGRIPDMKGSRKRTDPTWLLEYLKTATSWESQSSAFYEKTYAICTSESTAAAKECMQFISKPVSDLLISPPTHDTSTSARNRLSAPLHLIKCHGNRLDATFWGHDPDENNKKKAWKRAITSTTLKACLKPATVVGTTCCWGAQIFSPDARHVRSHKKWPLASTYLRKGALGFVGATGRVWFGGDTMRFADYIVGDYVKWILRHASIGRALLESKHGYICYYLEGGGTADALDQKTMVEYVLLGDPSIHPVAAKVSCPESKLDSQERTQRRAIHLRRAREIQRLLPKRTTATRAGAKNVYNIVQIALGKELTNDLAKFDINPAAARVARLETRVGNQIRQSLEYYWPGKRVGNEQTQTCLVRAETDLDGNLYRAYVGYST
jgi:hypothetical protein